MPIERVRELTFCGQASAGGTWANLSSSELSLLYQSVDQLPQCSLVKRHTRLALLGIIRYKTEERRDKLVRSVRLQTALARVGCPEDSTTRIKVCGGDAEQRTGNMEPQRMELV